MIKENVHDKNAGEVLIKKKIKRRRMGNEVWLDLVCFTAY